METDHPCFLDWQDMLEMETTNMRSFFITILMLYLVYMETSAQNTCPANSCNCNCDNSGNTEQIYDLQERVTCLESTVDQLASTTNQVIRDCSDIPEDGSQYGTYQLSPKDSEPFDAFCLFYDDGDWTVIQHRVNGNTDFNRGWVEYKHGFGTIVATGNFWLGLEKMHLITKQRQYRLQVEVTDWDGNRYYADYGLFSIGDEASKYAIMLKGYSGTLPDALTANSQGTPFTTLDQDNDSWSGNCAITYVTGWWHTACYSGQLNGPYRTPPNNAQSDPKGITWHPFNNVWVSMKASRMRIKPTFDE